MDPDELPCCSCACHCCAPPTWRRAVKRRLDEAVEPRLGPARVEAEEEAAALREALAGHQQTVAELCEELEEERSAASTAASEAMSMILRLQREKAEAQMELRQFKRFAEERFAHDQRELAALDDLLLRRDHALHSLSLQLQAFKHRLLALGFDPEADPAADQLELPPIEYPPLRIPSGTMLEAGEDAEYADDLDDYAETPQFHEGLENIENRIYQLERLPSSGGINVMEKAVVEPTFIAGPTKAGKPEEFPPPVVGCLPDSQSEGDDPDDRVYTIDAVHGAPLPVTETSGEPVGAPREATDVGGGGQGEVGDIKRLYARLQALEADRESMRQAIISMRTEKAQLVLLREIAQHLCKEVSPQQQKRMVKKPTSLIWSLSIMSVVKWILSFIFWRKKASRSKYTFGQSNNNVGLLLLLDKSPRMGNWRCLPKVPG